MARTAEKWLTLAALVIIGCLHGMAQTDQLLPEIDTYVKVSSDLRVSFPAKETREGGNPTQAEIGPSLDFYLKPLIRLALMTGCPVHKRSLLSRCPGCMKPLRSFRPGLLECHCSTSLRTADLPVISGAETDLLDIMRRRILGLAASRDYTSGLPGSQSLRADGMVPSRPRQTSCEPCYRESCRSLATSTETLEGCWFLMRDSSV